MPSQSVIQGDQHWYLFRNELKDELEQPQPQIFDCPGGGAKKSVKAGVVLASDRSGGLEHPGDRVPAEAKNPSVHHVAEGGERRGGEAVGKKC